MSTHILAPHGRFSVCGLMWREGRDNADRFVDEASRATCRLCTRGAYRTRSEIPSDAPAPAYTGSFRAIPEGMGTTRGLDEVVGKMRQNGASEDHVGQERLALEDVRAIVARVAFMDRTFTVLEKGDGFLVQLSYMEADVEHPERGPQLQKSRKWYVSAYSTDSEIVETCWACVKRSMLHVASEHFKYRGRRIYSQHIDVRARIEICDSDRFDRREPP